MSDTLAETVVLTKVEWLKLARHSAMLEALWAGGVNNWDWYSESLNDHYQDPIDSEPWSVATERKDFKI